MRGYYLFAPVEQENAGPESGVERKVRAQHKALNEYLECKLVILPSVIYSGSRVEKLIRRLPFAAAWRKWNYNGEFDDGDFLYIRQVYHDYSFLRYIKAIKKRNPKIRIIYEIPTYPYDTESKVTLANLSFSLKERINRKRLAKYIDRIVTFYGQKEIWGVPCIDLINGFDFAQVVLPERTLSSDIINIISVSATAFWHGYDRMIEGLHNYYENGGTENILYHMVGDILPEHKKLVEKYHLGAHVIFYGRKSGKDLQKLLNQAAIGIDVLGGHRKDYPVSSSLKSREYCAYGIPLITSSPVDFMPKEYKYQLVVPYDDSPIDVFSVVAFYHNIYDENDCANVANELRGFAMERCDMSITMRPVVDWINEKVDKGITGYE